jgi:hypothetical protein
MKEATCALCRRPVNPDAKGEYVEQTGWCVNRRGGGTNQLSLRKETGRYAHGGCVRLAVKGIDPERQEGLFG